MSSSLVDILRDANVECRLPGTDKHVRSGWVGLHCPNCGGSKFHLGIEIATGRCNCWRCGRQDVVAVLVKLTGISYREAAALWRGVAKTAPQRTEHDGRLQLPKGIGDLQPVHLAYLKRRGFDPEEIVRLWGVQGIGMHPVLGWRLFIPIHDKLGRVVSWTTRSVRQKATQRYISASLAEETIPHKTLLYGASLARHAVVVVEGPISAWSIGPGAVATFGLSYTPQQVADIAEYPVRVIAFDRGNNEQRRAERLCNELAVLPGLTEQVELESGSDPNECDPEEIAELRAKYLDFSLEPTASSGVE